MSDIVAKNKHRLSDKIHQDPTPVIGLAGLAAAVGYSIFHYRKRDKSIKPSVYIIQTRVIAQGIVVGALTISLAYRIYQNLKKPHVISDSLNIVVPKAIEEVSKP